MIRRLQIDNFKSLDGFSLPPVGSPPLGRFTCLIGANGTGKTSVLQAFDFLSHLTSTDLGDWFAGRGWTPSELKTRLLGQHSRSSLSFELDCEFSSIGGVQWSGKFASHGLVSESEVVTIDGDKVLDLSGGKLRFQSVNGLPLEIPSTMLKLNCSILAFLEDKAMPQSLLRLKSTLRGIKSLELLSPSAMRRSSRPSDTMGWSGEKLAGFFASLKPELRLLIQEKVSRFFPSLMQLRAKSKQGGYHTLLARERTVSNVDASHLGDGFLRILAIISQIEQNDNPDTVILLDEMENGLHPDLIEKLVVYLLQAKAQVIVTTHSPLILNYLSNDQAKDAMILLYRNRDGRTKSCRYFDLPSTRKKLGILGPGEVFADTPAEEVAEQAEEMERAGKPEEGVLAR